MAKFWPLVVPKIEELKKKAASVRMEINNIQEFMLRPNPTASETELDALISSAPEIEGYTEAEAADNEAKLLSIQRKVGWIATPSKELWIKPLTEELKRKRDNLSFEHQWRIYGEAILAEKKEKNDKDKIWKLTATEIEEEIKKDSVGKLNTWLDDVRKRAVTLNRLWEEGTRTITGTYGTIPQATVKLLFMRYKRIDSRDLLTAAVNERLAPTSDWGGVKYLSGGTYARELKIHEMDGDDRVLSSRADPTNLNRIGSLH
jgi:hypothetical protein